MSNVSIVIPTRNRLPLLQDAVASVERQTLQDLELVVIDDASEYGTSDWLGRRSGAGLRHIRLETPSERSAARNRGLDAATGEFVLFLDDDDRLLPTALETLVSGLRRHPHSIAVVGAYVMFDASGNRRRAGHPRREIQRHVWQDALFLWAANSESDPVPDGSDPGRGRIPRGSVVRRRLGTLVAGYASGLLVRSLLKALAGLVLGRRGTTASRRIRKAIRRTFRREVWPSKSAASDCEE